MIGKPNTKKLCNHCKKEKPISAFYKQIDTRGHKLRYHYNICRECKKQRQINYYKNNPTKIYKDYIEYQKSYWKTMRGKFYGCRKKSKYRGWTFTLTFPQFKKLLSLPCNYCGSSINIGLDRVDSTKGYIKGNVLPCCPTCNIAKSDMSYLNFISHCRRIVDCQNEKVEDVM